MTNFTRKVLIALSLLTLGMPYVHAGTESDFFIMTVDSTAADETPAGQMTIPTTNSNYQLFWEEVGNEGSNNSAGAIHANTANYVINFGSPGIYRIKIDPVDVTSGVNDFDRITFAATRDDDKLISIEQWGTTEWQTFYRSFRGTSKFTGFTSNDVPMMASVTTLSLMFTDATALVNTNGIHLWDTSSVTRMDNMFAGAVQANPDTSGWDTSSVIDMDYMFENAARANPDTSGWDTSSVTDMASMFENAVQANPDTSGWDTSSVVYMTYMFSGASVANPDTSGWDTSSVGYIDSMFRDASRAEPDTSGWDMSSVRYMDSMFRGASLANPDTSGWDTSSVRWMDSMFRDAPLANPDTSGWDTSSVEYVEYMFSGATQANPDTSGWDTSSVEYMDYMFSGATQANPDTSGWDTSSVYYMNSMFSGASVANPDISSWDTSSVENMNSMFELATEFDRDLSGFDFSNVTSAIDMLNGVTLSTYNYDELLNSLESQTLQPGLIFHGGSSNYCNGETARSNIITNDSWTIVDGGQDCTGPILTAILEDSDSTGGANNGDGVAITAAQLAEITGVSGVVLTEESAYQVAIAVATGFSDPPVIAEVQAIIDTVNALSEVLEDSASIGGGNNADGVAVTAAQLNHIIGLTDVQGANEAGYQQSIRSETGFSIPPTPAQVQVLIDAVNVHESALSAVLDASLSAGGAGSGNATLISIITLSDIVGLFDVEIENLVDYQASIAAESGFSEPLAVVELQVLISAVNASVVAQSEVLEDSASIGGANNADGVAVTVAQLNQIIGLTDVQGANEAGYQQSIRSETGFSNPPTPAQVQLLVDGVNAQVSALSAVLDASVSAGGAVSGDATLISINTLTDIVGLSDVRVENLVHYQALIAAEIGFSQPPTVVELQMLISAVNASVDAQNEVLEDSASAGGANNSNSAVVTTEELQAIIGITDVNSSFESQYQSLINQETQFSQPPTLAEIQLIIDRVNASTAATLLVFNASASEGSVSGLPVSAQTLSSITGLVRVDINHEPFYQALIATQDGFNNPPSLSQLQAVIDAVNNSRSAVAEVVEDSLSSSGQGNANGVLVTVLQLASVTGLSDIEPLFEGYYQSVIQSTTELGSSPSIEQLQTLIDQGNSNAILDEVLEDSLSSSGQGNANGVLVALEQLLKIIGLEDVDAQYIDGYRQGIQAERHFSAPPSVQEVQLIIDIVNANAGRAPTGDDDGDGVPNELDQDTDNDGLSDVEEGSGDTDGDGVADYRDLDSDNDGILDLVESRWSIGFIAALDMDRDGVVDVEHPVGVNGMVDQLETTADSGHWQRPLSDVDWDGIPDYRDLDSDNDGLLDSIESNHVDANLDGIVDEILSNGAMPNDVTTYGETISRANAPANLHQLDAAGVLPEAGNFPPDSDSDGRADFRDLDSDNDYLPDVIEAYGTSTDQDHDGQRDGFVDANANGVDDNFEAVPTLALDSDGDGIRDAIEVDSDADGLSDLWENGYEDLDTNGRADSWVDANENGTQDSQEGLMIVLVDTDDDGIPDYRDTDSDGDQITDFVESGAVDSNADGRADGLVDTDTLPDKDADGIPDLAQAKPQLAPTTGGGCSINRTGVHAVGTDPLLALLGLASLMWLLQRRCRVGSVASIRSRNE